MTRSVTIANTSNWDHEDYVVHATKDSMAEGETNRLGYLDGTRLRPGEKTSFTPVEGYSVTFEEIEEQEAVPMYVKKVNPTTGKRDDGQVWPVVKVEISDE